MTAGVWLREPMIERMGISAFLAIGEAAFRVKVFVGLEGGFL